MFNGETGKAMSTVPFNPPRGTVASWGDSYGNRVDRFLAATAYLDGKRPSLIMSRGYYTRTVITAWDYRDGKLTQRWVFDSDQYGSKYTAQGDHQMSVADVDGDGKDEIIFGAMAIDDDGKPLWDTGLGHGDALHVGDLDPSRPGLEEFKVDEHTNEPSSWFADAKTGQVLWKTAPNGDNGRGVSDDIWAGSPGAESWSANGGPDMFDTKGQAIGRKPSSMNFLVWWDADPVRELLDRTHIDKYTPTGDQRLLTADGVTSNNGTKATPSLSGDLFGDWREEVIWPTADASALRIYATPIPTTIRITTLLDDTMYREALAWQNTGYNQPPHPSFFIGNDMKTPPKENVYTP
jgi:rhamnogalacturonan endolyase